MGGELSLPSSSSTPFLPSSALCVLANANGKKGAILHDMPADDDVASMQFAGSTVILVAESRQAVLDALKDDVYVSSGVWDLEKVSWLAKGLLVVVVGREMRSECMDEMLTNGDLCKQAQIWPAKIALRIP